MRRFDRLHSYTDRTIFLGWIDKDKEFIINKEVGEGYFLVHLGNDCNNPVTANYYETPPSERRNASMRQILTTYNRLKNEL